YSLLLALRHATSPLFPYTTLFRSTRAPASGKYFVYGLRKVSICSTVPRFISREMVLELRPILLPISRYDKPSCRYAVFCPLSISVKCVNLPFFVLELV